jgi:hypothetical protein
MGLLLTEIGSDLAPGIAEDLSLEIADSPDFFRGKFLGPVDPSNKGQILVNLPEPAFKLKMISFFGTL